jgi:imidazoleglycerol phosphate dehydratase HisB
MSDRTATVSRKTNETEIEVYINLDCQPGSASQQIINISTGIGFLDHVRLRFSTHTTVQLSDGEIKHDLTHDSYACMHARIDVQRPCQAQRNVSHAQGQR